MPELIEISRNIASASVYGSRPINALCAIIGDSISAAFSSAASVAANKTFLTLIKNNLAVAGSKIADQKSKVNVAKSYGAKYLMVQVGSNDVSTPETAYADYVELFSEIYDKGLIPIVSYIPPRDASLTKNTYKINVALYFACKKKGINVYDPWMQFALGAGGWNAPVDALLLHPKPTTRATAGDTLSTQIINNGTYRPLIRSYIDSLCLGAGFQSDTNTDGLSDGWGESHVGSTHSYSRTQYRDGMYWQLITSTNPQANDSATVFQSINVVGGHKYLLTAVMNATCTDANDDKEYFSFILRKYKNNQFATPSKNEYHTQSYILNSEYELCLELDIESDITGIRIEFVRTCLTSYTGISTYKIRNVGLVDITELGIQ